MFFMDADQGAPSGSAANTEAAPEKKSEPAAPEKTDTETAIDHKAKLLALLGLDETADEAAIDAKCAEVTAALSKLPDLETTAGDATSQLEAANAELEKVRGEYQALFERDQAANKAKQEAEVDAILEQFADRFTDDKAKARIRLILLSDREGGLEILNGLPAPGAVSTEEKKADKPASPQHDPNAEATAASETEKAQKISARAKELVKNSNPKISLTKAYQLAEQELEKPAA